MFRKIENQKKSWIPAKDEGPDVDSNGPAHQNVSVTVPSNFCEALLLKHRHRPVRRFISESRSEPAPADSGAAKLFPENDGIGLHKAPALLPDGFESGSQGSARCPASAMLPIDNKAGNSPELLRGASANEASILGAIINAREFFSGTVLAPANGLSFHIHKDSVRASFLDEGLLFPPVPHTSLDPQSEPIVLGQRPRPVKMHAPTEIPSIALRKKSPKVRPGFFFDSSFVV
jgi:hypothetical protein